MSVAPFAIWRPLPPGVNHSAGGMYGYDGVILHIMEGILDGTDSWFRNPQAQASAHFGVGKDGRVYQWVDTADKAWAQAAGFTAHILSWRGRKPISGIEGKAREARYALLGEWWCGAARGYPW